MVLRWFKNSASIYLSDSSNPIEMAYGYGEDYVMVGQISRLILKTDRTVVKLCTFSLNRVFTDFSNNIILIKYF